MYACPKCESKTIRFVDKVTSHGLSPVECSKCGAQLKPAEDSQLASSMAAFSGVLGIPLIGIWSTAIKSWLPLIFSIVILSIWSLLAFHKKTMVEVNIEKEMRGHWVAFLILFCIFIGLLIHVVYNK